MEKKWWQATTIYQIYPRSFYDANQDGFGDLEGIIQKLDYLKELGIQTIWISPFFQSPGQDHGYDISDYYGIDPLLGSMDDCDRLIKEVHKRGLKVIFDMVLNHTSIEHEWFKESRSSEDNPKRGWYIWRKGLKPNGKKAPNNWRSMIGTKGWNYDALTDSWFYTSFLEFQPDLNWNNPELREVLFNMVRFYLDKGVDGFRLDIFNCVGKNQNFPNNPFYPRFFPTPDDNDHCFWQNKLHNINHPDSFAFAKDLRAVIDEYPDRFIVGEVSGSDSILKKFLGENCDGLNLVFQFELLHFKFNKLFFQKFINKMNQNFPDPLTPTLVYSNHDLGRGIARVQNSVTKAKLLALFQLTSRGVPVLYYGDEIGMGNHDLPFQGAEDPIAEVYGKIPKKLSQRVGLFLNRDDARTPMQWDSQRERGFTLGSKNPWLPTIPNTKGRDVNSEKIDSNSLLNCYSTLLDLRKRHKALHMGFLELMTSPTSILFYKRVYGSEKIAVLFNFSSKKKLVHNIPFNQTLFSSSLDTFFQDNTVTLSPWGGIILI